MWELSRSGALVVLAHADMITQSLTLFNEATFNIIYKSIRTCQSGAPLYTVGRTNVETSEPYEFIGILIIMLKNTMNSYGFWR